MTLPTLDQTTFRRIADLMHTSVGLSFADSKKALVNSRLSTRLQRLGLDRFEDYLERLQHDADGIEFQCAIDLLTTNETYFFREPAHFELLADELKDSGRPAFAAWSAASSFGDEAFSIAMLLADFQRQGDIGADWSVLGTDISDRVLRSASSGVFPQDRLRQVSPERLKRYCLRGEGAAEGLVQVRQELRQHVRFGQLNLTQPVIGLGPFDVVFLRNVLIYFDEPTKRRVVDNVLTRLKPGGLFFIGTAEGRVACETPLEALAPGAFRKRNLS